MNKTLITTLFTAAFLFLYSKADAYMIDFQKLYEDGEFILSDAVSNQFALDGVLFESYPIWAPYFYGPVIDAINQNDLNTIGLFNSGSDNKPIITDFTVTVDYVSFSSIDGSPLTAMAFNSSDIMIANSTIAGKETGELSATEKIAYVKFINDQGTGYNDGTSDLTIIRSMEFKNVALPESATILYLATGLLSIICIRKKRAV